MVESGGSAPRTGIAAGERDPLRFSGIGQPVQILLPDKSASAGPDSRTPL